MKKAAIITTVVILLILVAVAIFFVLHKASPVSPQKETQVSGVSDNDVNSVGQDVNAVNDSDFGDNALDSLG